MTGDAHDPKGALPGEGDVNNLPALEVEAPRRAASARFDVAERGDAGFRDALDPATQSLGVALKLSYRILQAGMGETQTIDVGAHAHKQSPFDVNIDRVVVSQRNGD